MTIYTHCTCLGALFLLGTLGGGPAGCGNNGSSLGDQPTLDAQIADWGTLSGHTLEAQSDESGSTLATAPIDDNGHFRIVLPGQSTLQPYLVPEPPNLPPGVPFDPSGCTGSYQSDPTPARLMFLDLAVNPMIPGSSYLQMLGTSQPDPETMISFSVRYVYFDRDYYFTGMYDCSGIQTVYDLHYSTGWNTQLLRYTSRGTGSAAKVIKAEVITAPPPDGAQWFIHN